MAVLTTGDIVCWGTNSGYCYGDTAARGAFPGTMGNTLPLMDLGTGESAAAVYGGEFHSCAWLSNGKVKCWGSGERTGYEDTTERGSSPGFLGNNLPYVSLGGDDTVALLAVGRYHSCALLDGIGVKCWGDNTYGELGQGDSDVRGTTASTMGDQLPAVDLGDISNSI
eukprot:4930741-Amphidinium_carterae.1